jgi:hypothetical protein
MGCACFSVGERSADLINRQELSGAGVRVSADSSTFSTALQLCKVRPLRSDLKACGAAGVACVGLSYVSMRLLGLVIGALVILVSAISFAVPDLRLSFERSVTTPAGLEAIAAVRIAIGLVFVLAAPASRAPRTLRTLGLIVIIAGLMTPWFGVTRGRAVLDWLASAGPLLMRLDTCVGMALGAFLVYVFRTPTRPSVPLLEIRTK